jgi:hypothetical protein
LTGLLVLGLVIAVTLVKPAPAPENEVVPEPELPVLEEAA